MRRIWLDSYPKGVPPDIDVRGYPSLKDLLERSCLRFREKIAFTNMGVAVTYGELDRLSRDFGAYLQNGLGLRKADRLAIMLPNLLQYPVSLFGALRTAITRERRLALMEGVVLTSNTMMTRFARALGFEVRPVANDPTTRRSVKKL